MAARAAVQEAVSSRLRPIAMTTLTTIFGLLPLVVIPGEGTELYRGVGAIVLFGLAGTAIITLTFLPTLTVSVLEWSERRRTAVSASDVPATGPCTAHGNAAGTAPETATAARPAHASRSTSAAGAGTGPAQE